MPNTDLCNLICCINTLLRNLTVQTYQSDMLTLDNEGTFQLHQLSLVVAVNQEFRMSNLQVVTILHTLVVPLIESHLIFSKVKLLIQITFLNNQHLSIELMNKISVMFFQEVNTNIVMGMQLVILHLSITEDQIKSVLIFVFFQVQSFFENKSVM